MSRRPLYISATGGSGLGAPEVFRCPRRVYYFREGWRRRYTPSYFWYGTRIHHWAFLPYLEPEKVDNLPEQARMDIAKICIEGKYEWIRQRGAETKPTKITELAEVSEKEIIDLPRMADVMIQVWDKRKYDPDNVEYCEYRYRMPLVDPKRALITSEADELNTYLVGRWDIGLRKPRSVIDLKTSQNPLENIHLREFGYHRQVSIYRYAYKFETGMDPEDVGFFQLTKHMTFASIAKYAHLITLPKPMKYYDVYQWLLSAARAVRKCEDDSEKMSPRDAWPQYWNCSGPFGDPCEFAPFCYANNWPTRESWEEKVKSSLTYRKEE